MVLCTASKKCFRKDNTPCILKGLLVCCLRECGLCEDFKKSDECLLNCPTLFNEARRYKWNAFSMVCLDNGNEQKELQPNSGSLTEFRETFNESSHIYV